MLVCLWAATLSPLPVLAQTASGPDDPGAASEAAKEQAKRHFETGLPLFKKGAWDPALAEFLRSRELYPTRAATKNAALALKELHRYDEALDMLDALKREFPDLPPDERQLIEQEANALRALIGTIDVRSSTSGASISIGGRARGTTPLGRGLRVPAGTHLVRLFKQGYSPKEARVEVAGGQNVVLELALDALAKSGRLNITEQTGRKVDVVIDNVVVGQSPWGGDLAPGQHVVALRGEGKFGTQPVAAPVREGQTTRLTLVLEELDSELRVEPTPVNASVALDGVELGRGLWEGRVRAGAHTVEVAAEGFLSSTRQIETKSGSRRAVAVKLERDPNSSFWGSQNLPAFVVEAFVGAATVLPGLGGEVSADCGGCDKSFPIGVLARLSPGYRFRSGLALWLDAGYLRAQQKLTNRKATLYPRGIPTPPVGVVNDELRLSGFLIGAAAGLQRGEKWTWTLRLGAGAFIGTLRDARAGRFPNSVAPSEPSFGVGPVTETPDARYLYVAPSASLGYRLGDSFALGLGLNGIAMFGLTQPKWTNRSTVLAGAGCGKNLAYPACLGEAEYKVQTLAEKTLIVVSPGLDLRYEFH